MSVSGCWRRVTLVGGVEGDGQVVSVCACVGVGVAECLREYWK